MENLQAMRALKAFEFANDGNEKQKAKKKFNYAAAVQELPSLIRMNGLRSSMAYFYSKEGQHKLVFEQIQNWFRDENEPTRFMSAKFKETSTSKQEQVFMKILLELSDDEYRIAQAETLTLANWMIRFVKTEDSKPNLTTNGTE